MRPAFSRLKPVLRHFPAEIGHAGLVTLLSRPLLLLEVRQTGGCKEAGRAEAPAALSQAV
jgi:hypothetical protein